MNLSGYYERIHKCCRYCRIYYADYIIDDSALLVNLAKNLSRDELDWLLQNHTELCLRVNHHLFEYDDLARAAFFKSKNRELAIKIYKIAQGLCKSGMDYAFLAIAIHKTLRVKKWCKELLAMAENNIKDGLCYVNMLNFIEIKTLSGLKAENFLQNALTTTNFKEDFYLTMALELKQIGGFDEFAYKFYKKCIEKDRRDYYLSYARVFIKDKGELKALGIKPKQKEQKEAVASKVHKSKDEYLSELRETSDFYKFYDILDDMAEEFGKQRWILELYKDGENYAKTAADYAYVASGVMRGFKDKIYARELLAKAVELLPDPRETFFVLDILKELGDKELLAMACEKLLSMPDPSYMRIASYLKNINPNLAKECAVKAVENAKTRTEILHAATDVLDIFKDKGWAIEIVKNGIIDVVNQI
ncbi:hypothetical protein [uncultured Campylobacter sp.]|uniref:hypothetical protein n=1 Tax=uncultured Campylobacter sp. TaxID=218934 RepID=UPI00262F1C3D|nr:hypothetical protein [uncultured Campylobacter sp.]